MTASVLLAAVTIAFPREGQRFGAIDRCYLIGATDGGETNLVVAGRSVPVYRTGAWGVLVDVVPGTNTVLAGGVSRTFYVAPRRKPAPGAKPAPEKKYKKLPYAGDVPKAHPAGRAPGDTTIVLDPGHGGTDTGAVSPHGWFEKDANLLLADEVRSELEKKGYRVVMTRRDDTFPALYDRPKVAHAGNADAFVSIHHNAPPHDRDPIKSRYHCVYAWNPLGERLAKAINLRMASSFGASLANNGVMHANFAVTRNPEIPSCLIETDFVSSPAGEESIWDPAVRRRTAAAIAAGIADWCSQPATSPSSAARPR